MDLNVKNNKLLRDNIKEYCLDFGTLPGREKDTKDITIKGAVDKFAVNTGTFVHWKTQENN